MGFALRDRVLREHPPLAGVGEREQLLAAAWMVTQRSARTRRGYALDYLAWLTWLTDRGVDVLSARRTHVELWGARAAEHRGRGLDAVRRLSALSGFYRHCAAHDLIAAIPTAGIRRPEVSPDYTATIGLDRDRLAP